ncbi:ATP-dependent DNA helicase [Mesoplasma photuris]|uniref:ATP-dependent DNA helicase n=1 Tax=Mesoplasma photuris TaxID=217731 RepID=UPI0004E12E6C|nr:AAA family ATPase [Mesoplasma photuris]
MSEKKVIGKMGYKFKVIDKWAMANFFDPENERKSVVIQGNITDMIEGMYYELSGYYIKNDRGSKFIVEDYHEANLFTIPNIDMKEAITTYFSSEKFVGVGPIAASHIYEHFKEVDNILETIYQDLNQLDDIEKLKPKQIEVIKKVLTEQIEQKEVTSNFIKKGLSINILNKIRKYLLDEKQVLDHLGIGIYTLYRRYGLKPFDEVDKIALAYGVEITDPIRIAFLLWRKINLYTEQKQHTFVKFEGFYDDIKRSFANTEIAWDSIINIAQEIKLIKIVDDRLYTYNAWKEEQFIAEQLLRLQDKSVKAINKDISLQFIDELNHKLEKQNQSLGIDQRKALEMFVNNNVLILTGGPGTGKTKTISWIIETFYKLYSINDYVTFAKTEVAVAAPTGRAASRIKENLKQIDTSTIHRLLKYKGEEGFGIDWDTPLEQRLIIIDECSMIDQKLFYNMLRGLRNCDKLVLVGDENQLPSIGYGNIFSDLIKSNTLPIAKLNEQFRAKDNEDIIDLSTKIINQEIDDIQWNDYHNIKTIFEINSEVLVSKIKESLTKNIAQENIDLLDYQFISPIKKGKIGTNQINALIQKEFNLQTGIFETGRTSFGGESTHYKIGDKVMYIVNNSDKDIYNGDIGVIKNIDVNINGSIKEIHIDFYIKIDGNKISKEITLGRDELENLILAYSSTVHKTQGSEYDYVFLTIEDMGYLRHGFLNRNLVYTAVTRSKKQLYIIGSEDQFKKAIKVDPPVRNTTLVQVLKEFSKS